MHESLSDDSAGHEIVGWHDDCPCFVNMCLNYSYNASEKVNKSTCPLPKNVHFCENAAAVGPYVLRY